MQETSMINEWLSCPIDIHTVYILSIQSTYNGFLSIYSWQHGLRHYSLPWEKVKVSSCLEVIQITDSITHTQTQRGTAECKLNIQQLQQRHSCVTSNKDLLTPSLKCWFAMATMAWNRQQRCGEITFHPLIRGSDSFESGFKHPE